MTILELWLITALIALGTYALRLSFVAFGGQRAVSARAHRVLRLLPAAVLATLILPSVLFANAGPLDVDYDRLFAAVLASLVAWRTRSALSTLVVGMIVLWVLRGMA